MMRKLSRLLLLTGVLGGVPMWAGCGDSGSDKPVVVIPDVPPAEAAKSSMDAYLKDHPAAAKKAGKGMAP